MQKYFLMILLLAFQAEAATVEGVVKDGNSGYPLEDVNIRVLNHAIGSSTDAKGRFSITLQVPDVYIIQFERVGYQIHLDTLAIRQTETRTLDVNLKSVSLLMDPVVVTANRYQNNRWDQPEALTVINSNALEIQAGRSTPEALIGAAGVWMQKTNHGSGSPFIRGLTGNQVLILVDNIRLNNTTFRYGPNQYLNTITPEVLQRVEILRGAGATLYGSDALGGVINLITKEPYFNGTGWKIKSQISGKYITQNMEKSATLALEAGSPKVAFRADLARRIFGDLVAGEGLGKEAPSAYDEWAGNTQLRFRLDDRLLLSFAYQHVQQNNVPRYDQVAQKGYSRYSFDPQIRQLAYSSLKWFPADPLWREVRLTGSWQRSHEERFMQKQNSLSLTHERDLVETWGINVEVYNRLAANWQAISGVELYFDDVLSSASVTDQSTGFVLSRRGLYPDGSFSRNTAIYSKHQIQWNHWEMNAGLRYNDVHAEAIDKSFGDINISPRALVGDAGLLYELTDTQRIGFNLNSAFRAPNINDMSSFGSFDFGIEVPSTELSPEKALNYEAVWKMNLSELQTGVSVFYSRLYDLITRTRGTYQGDSTYLGENVYKKQNTAEAYIQGVEVEVVRQFFDHFELGGFLVYTYGQNTSAAEPLGRIPPLNGQLFLRYNHHAWWFQAEGLVATRQDRLSAGDKNDHRIPVGGTPGWQVFNLRGGWRYDFFSIGLGLLNLFDEAYRLHGSGVDGCGRSGYVTLKIGL
jgi:outer membrane receptor protein involved in Fe transport